MVPSRLRPSSTYCTWPRPCIDSIASVRVSAHVTGRPSRRAARAIAAWSVLVPALPPKAPPTWGATTRTCSGSTPIVFARMSLAMWGCWVDTQASMPSAVGRTRMALPSIGAVAMRWLTMRTRTTWSASSRTSSVDLAARKVAMLEPIASNCNGAPSASASSGSVTAGRSS